MTTTLNAIETRLRDAVMRQLAWDPEFDASMIGTSSRPCSVSS